MPVGWFFAPTLLDTNPWTNRPRRRCALEQFKPQLRAEGGTYRGVECFGDQWIAKVRASNTLLSTISATAGFIRIPPRFLGLSQTLGDLSAQERTALNNRLLALGYTQGEIDATVGSTNGQWRSRTLGQVLTFARSRWRRPLMLDGSGNMVFESEDWAGGCPGDLSEIDATVPDA